MLNVMLSVIILSVIVLSVVMLSVIMVNVMEPKCWLPTVFFVLGLVFGLYFRPYDT
jgi:hypothetical protein